MKTLYIEANMGAAGDMLTAALVELFDDKEKIVAELNSLGIPDVTYTLSDSIKCSIKGSHISVSVAGVEEEIEHTHSHDENHHHHHNTMNDIRTIVYGLNVKEKVKEKIMEVYQIIAQAESFVHGTTVEQVHFHEVGAMDAVADITAVCYLIDKLNVEKITSSAINTGNGYCRTMHGILPVPAPATAKILEGMASYDDGVRGELCTPTGAALIKAFSSSYGPRPNMRIEKIGNGMGKKDFERANCIRLFLGESENALKDSVILLEANVDDMSGEDISYALECLISAGALDVWTSAVNMKKSRPGVIISALVKEEDEERLVNTFFKHTTTIGIRREKKERYILQREIKEVKIPSGSVRVKCSTGYGVNRIKAEFEDLKALSKQSGKAIKELRDEIISTI